MSELQATGERVLEDAYRSSPGMYAIYLMHLASYRFAMPFVTGKRVLDLGCGSGYGSALIARNAQEVVAVDVSEEAVGYAKTRYVTPNLHYQRINAEEPLPFPERSFDVVLSFQVIEHVQDDRNYIEHAHAVLAEGGVLIVITPDRAERLLPLQQPWNRWHLREYSANSLASLFNPDAFDVDIKHMTASPALAGMELRRYRRLKWLTLPITLPFIPQRWRVSALNQLHRFEPTPSTEASAETVFPFNDTDVLIGDHRKPSLNLVVVARKRAA